MKRSAAGRHEVRVVLVGLVLVMLGGLGMVALASAQGMPPPPPGKPAGPMPRPGPERTLLDALRCDRLPPELQLSLAQREKLQTIDDGLRADQMQWREEGRALADRWTGLLSAPTVDAQAVEALRSQMEQAHDAMSRRLVQATLDAAAVLTPAQRAQLVSLSEPPPAGGAHGERRGLEEGPPPDMPGMPPPFLVQ